MSEREIWVVSDRYDVEVRGDGRWNSINIATLRTNLEEFVGALHEMLDGLDMKLASYCLNEIEVSVEIGASGKVGLLGTGAEGSAKAGLQLRLTRKINSGAS